jgi:NAD(P)-dependent dehydrogenase (short-subunit alcohol dehydrogenase family)
LSTDATGRFGACNPPHRTGLPDERAKAGVSMASDLASYVSGTSLLIDGAQTLA